MTATNDAGRFFQTTDSIVENERKSRKSANTFGKPVKFPSKILAVEHNAYFDGSGDVLFAAEAAGTVTGLRLSTNELSASPRGPAAPLTCLASYGVGNAMRIFAGCWDKSIWTYTFELGATDAGKKVTNVSSFPAHADFVKCLVVAPTPDKQPVLISGGADGDVRFWTLEGKPLAKISPGCRGIESMVIDPLSSPESPVVVFSTSQREIFQLTIPSLSEISASTVKLSNAILAHETSVYSLHFDGDGDLWTASADKTAKRLVRENGWQPDTVLQHPDFVRDIVTHDKYGLVITACRDEEVRVWNRGTGALVHVFTGHFEEVTALALSGDMVLSVGIDATLRRWSLAPGDMQRAVSEAANPKLVDDVAEPQNELGMLTAEEEAELQAMMESEEADTLEKMARDDQ
ncbi:uncharacterized protein HMPREF1541_08901 [Cyphellophora europaea CBS 101466]|uniref:Mitochondrial division protein 1 n=1 Tax=Cyphellophora europaea (strain CBS 101466) TaxID=1220924 RepID=W2RLN4_CYPE1|nr:uncharacterized protein HMPREF1541_08901 [Cyphellophora europaea CBS 101466]ETN36623.1 hypothetical protein HMPREF1541_08901 [Cyphellophora europaea CBS 101466]